MSQYPQYQQQQPLQHSNLPYQAAPQSIESLGSWVLTTFLMFIPLVNIIYLLVLAFSGGSSIAKKNFARASLIWVLVGIVLSVILGIILAMAGVSLFNELSETYPTTYGY